MQIITIDKKNYYVLNELVNSSVKNLDLSYDHKYDYMIYQIKNDKNEWIQVNEICDDKHKRILIEKEYADNIILETTIKIKDFDSIIKIFDDSSDFEYNIEKIVGRHSDRTCRWVRNSLIQDFYDFLSYLSNELLLSEKEIYDFLGVRPKKKLPVIDSNSILDYLKYNMINRSRTYYTIEIKNCVYDEEYANNLFEKEKDNIENAKSIDDLFVHLKQAKFNLSGSVITIFNDIYTNNEFIISRNSKIKRTHAAFFSFLVGFRCWILVNNKIISNDMCFRDF
jgi:hypothetical protein